MPIIESVKKVEETTYTFDEETAKKLKALGYFTSEEHPNRFLLFDHYLLVTVEATKEGAKVRFETRPFSNTQEMLSSIEEAKEAVHKLFEVIGE